MKNRLIIEAALLIKQNDFKTYTWLFQNIFPVLRNFVSLNMLDITE